MAKLSLRHTLKPGQYAAFKAVAEVLRFLKVPWTFPDIWDEATWGNGRFYREVCFGDLMSEYEDSEGYIVIYTRQVRGVWYATSAMADIIIPRKRKKPSPIGYLMHFRWEGNRIAEVVPYEFDTNPDSNLVDICECYRAWEDVQYRLIGEENF